MKTFLKWVDIGFGALAGIIAIVFVVIYFKSQARLTRIYDLHEKTVEIPTDPAALELGHR